MKGVKKGKMVRGWFGGGSGTVRGRFGDGSGTVRDFFVGRFGINFGTVRIKKKQMYGSGHKLIFLAPLARF